ncbi:MAG: hypothetical protein GXO86_01610 [Chlorobi bacterium]|nr:hypothetical protein [Chlorobiota bacterium]
MKRKRSAFALFVLLGVVILFNGCSTQLKNRDFIIPKSHPATALTIGWYVPVEVMKEIVGPDFKPKVVHEGDMTSVMLYIVKSDEHVMDGTNTGPMKAAHLIIPVETLTKVSTRDKIKIENFLVCPVTIVDQSKKLGDKYNAFGFPTYSGKITLDVKKSGKKFNVDATIKTVNGFIEIKGMFDEKGKKHNLTSAIFTPKQGFHSYFYGEESMRRIENGKGNLKLDGQNIISAMQLNKLPFFLKLDRNVTWAFDFVE